MGASSGLILLGCRCYLCACLALGCTTYDESLRGGSASVGSDPGDGGTFDQTSNSGGSGSVEARGGAAGSGGTTGNAGTEASAGKGGGSAIASGGTSGSGGTEAVGTMNGGDGTAMAGAAGAPSCESETVSEFCARTAKDCGLASGTDNCGMPVSAVECGACPVLESCGGAGQPNVCGALTELAGGTATASSEGSIAETANQAFDGNVSTKWYAGDGVKTGWLAFQFSGTSAHVVISYALTSANDVPARDPAAWQLEGSNDGSSWTTLDQRKGESFPQRNQTKSYPCSSSTAFRWYRLQIIANSGGNEVQLAELVLLGS